MNRLFKKGALLAFAFASLVVVNANAQLIITGMVDGTNTGGNPKGMEIFSTSAIADLSNFYIIRDTNGAGPWDTFVQLPTVALAANSFFYVAGNTDSASALNGFGFTVGLTNSVLSINGDDIIGLATPNVTFTTGSNISEFDVIDAFGQESQGDTNFYEDSIAYRDGTSLTPVPAGVLDAGNFNISGYSDLSLQSTFGTYAIPEPSTFALISVGLAGLLFHRRRRQG
ncbi:MAG: PEP-CTERM sorting domain-containing protein [Verrucomicrobiota bacterium]